MSESCDLELVSGTTIENEGRDTDEYLETLALVEAAIDDALPRSRNLQGLARPVERAS